MPGKTPPKDLKLRHRKSKDDGVEGAKDRIYRKRLKKLSHRAGITRSTGECPEYIINVMEENVRQVLTQAMIVADYSRKKTVSGKHVRHALQNIYPGSVIKRQVHGLNN